MDQKVHITVATLDNPHSITFSGIHKYREETPAWCLDQQSIVPINTVKVFFNPAYVATSVATSSSNVGDVQKPKTSF